jgi:hypothetical protein
MKLFSSLKAFGVLAATFLFCTESFAVFPATCPTMQKRNNGNGQWGSCAGQGGIAVAPNVVGTSYANFFSINGIAPDTKTGDINFYWPGVTNITNLYVITRVWVGTTILPTKVGPPPVPEIRNGNTYATYCFYVLNLPNAGVLTLEFTNPQTNQPAYLCSYDLRSGTTVSSPVSCAPTIISEPSSKAICTDTTSFRISASGVTTYQWQRSTDNGANWNNITAAPFTGFNSPVLNITSAASSYSGNRFRVILIGSSGTCSTTSNSYTLTSYPRPTAAFEAGANVCGVGTYNLKINLTGTGPWSFTYTTNGGSPTTISNIASSTYYLPVTVSATTTYAIIALNDRFCANYSSSTPVTIVVQDKPTISLTSPVNYCFSNVQGTATLNYTGTGNSPTQYSITPGTRSMGGFNNVLNASNVFNSGSGSVNITIPASIAPGTYDFNMRVRIPTPGTGCESDPVTFTIIVRPAPAVTVTSSASSVCLNGSVTLTASPDLSGVGGHTYAWTGATVASPSAVSTAATVTAGPSTYTVTVTQTSTGCTASGSTTVTLRAGANITVNSPTICLGDRAVLTASGGITYSWSLSPSGPTAELSATSGATVLATPVSAGTRTYRVIGTSSTGCPGFADATVTVNSGLNISVTPSTSICPGGSIQLDASTVQTGTTFSWAPTSSLSPSSGQGASVTATPTTTTTYTVTGINGSCAGSASTTITIYSPPVSTVPPRNIAFCNGDMNGNDLVQLTLTTSSNVTVTWEYLVGTTWTAITSTASNDARYRTSPSANSFTLNLKNAAFTSATETKYRVGVIAGGCTVYYNTDLINLSATPTFDISSAQTICSGSAPALLSSNLTYTNGTSNKNYTAVYQWQVSTNGTSFTDITGANSATYQPPSISVNTWYRVGVEASVGSACDAIFRYSNSVLITVVSSVSGNTISGNDCSSGPATLTGSAITGASYRWQSSTNGSSWSDIPGGTGQNYTGSSVLTQKTWFRRWVTVGGCTNVSTNTILTPAILGNGIGASQTVCINVTTAAFGPVTPSGGEGSFTYQWQSAPDNSGVPGTWANISTATTNNYTPPATSAGITWYRLQVTSGACVSFSNESSVTVNALPAISVAGGNVSVCQGLSVTLTAQGGASYTWSPSDNLNVTSGAVVISTPTATRTYTITGTSANGCVNTGSVTVTYVPAPTAPASFTGTSTQCFTGTPSIDLNTTFLSNSVSNPEVFQWFTENTNPPVAAPVANPTATSGTYYAFTRNTSTGCFSTTSVTATLTLISNNPPTPLVNSFAACTPATYNLRSAEPTAPSGTTWEWSTSTTIGSTAPADPTAVGQGTYYLFGRNGTCTTAASAAVNVTINALPTIAVHSPTESVCEPNKYNLSSSYTGAASGFIYQWYTAASNPTPASLVTDPTSVGAGTYYLYATNTTTLCRTASPNSVTVTVNSRPALSITAPSLSCEGQSAVSITGTSSGLTSYQWYEVNTTTNTVTPLTNNSPYSNGNTHTLGISSTSGLASNLYYYTAADNTTLCPATSDRVSIPLETPVTCTGHPSSVFLTTLPNTASFTAGVSDINANIKWQVSTDNAANWRDLTTTGADATNYSGIYTTRLDVFNITNSMNDFKYRAVTTSTVCSGGCTTGMATLNTPIALPVSGVTLQVNRVQNNLQLRWVAFSEQDITSYEIQYAADGVNYRSIDKVTVANPSFTVKEYQLLTLPMPGYYRVKANGNRSGDFAFSNTVYYNDRERIKTGLHPNPAVSGEVTVNMTGLVAETPVEVNVFSVEGRLLQKTTMMLSNGNNLLKLNGSVQERPLVIVRIHQPEVGELLHTKLMIAR